MPNTFSSGLICNTCCDAAMDSICQVLGPLNNFANECSPDPLAPLKPVSIPVATAGSTTLTDPTNFEAGDTTLANILVTPHHISQPFHITHAQYNQGFRLEQLARINATALATAVWNVVLPIIKNSATPTLGFPVANVVVSAIASFTPATVGSAYAKLLCQPKHLLLDPTAMSKLMYQATGCCMPIPGVGPGGFGFQSISEHSLWATADANTYGFGFCPEAIAVVSGVPAKPPACGTIIEQQNITIPGTGLTVQFNLWCSSATRALWGSYDIIFGAALGVICKGVLIKSA